MSEGQPEAFEESERAMRIRQNRTPSRHSSLVTRHALPGFTLVEMLTVIGIIVLLVSILLPVVSAVRTKGHAADTQALLARIATGIESYHADFKAYPGPISNADISRTPGPTITLVNIPGQTWTWEPTKITQSENLYLGLVGGLKLNASNQVVFDPSGMGQGPMSLNPRNPKKYRAYMDNISITPAQRATSGASAGHVFKDEAATANDTVIPEFVDKFPDALPILYMRANPGASGIVSNITASTGTQEQYDLRQIIGYTDTNIGVGKDLPQSEYKGPALQQYAQKKHGLRTATSNATVYETMPRPPNMGTTYSYPFDLYAFMRHPTVANTPKNKDGYILISAGADRVYGTRDDLQYPPSR